MPKWSIDPPCKAEQCLENLFLTKKIGASDTALKIQKEHEIFKGYSQAVFRNHFKRLRDRHGLGLGKLSINKILNK